MKPHLIVPVLACCLGIGDAAVPARGAEDPFGNWPQGASPREIGSRIVENFLPRQFLWQRNERNSFVYFEVCTWYGALEFAAVADDAEMQRRLVAKYDILGTSEGRRMISTREHVDFTIFGALPLEIYLRTGTPHLLTDGRAFADLQWATTTPDGITAQARYWIDDIYMVNLLQCQAFRATGEMKYLDRAALLTVAYLDKLQRPNGLFFHAEDSPFYWGRGNGWFAAGMTELLRSLPADHPQRARILAGFRLMMAELARTQREDGLWTQLIDHPDFWPETSGSAMFAFAMVTGVKERWLDPAIYGPAARRAWLALVAQLDGEANLREVCEGTNKAAMVVGPDLATQLEFYRARPRVTGNLHGQAPMLWTATALLR